ncbi:hypothetical protein JK358_00990 [Nocardia sp. 2]|uniref:Uncharacterized protein n=1 Tax=Nocardia acididurans TaxID=2802282 RepID=A0ABS1LXV4_9NOCA|nr:hypothetical protein [Nocardia acididurans]MBL1072965.1 hypothetical protein [Nocardia acididurans]
MPQDTPPEMYLDYEALRALGLMLREIPSLAEDLDDAVACRARLSGPNIRLHSRTSDQPLPFSTTAAAVRDHLHATLVSWVRLICEQRAIDYTGPTSTTGLARWLERNLLAFAMTEGVESAPDDIRAAVADAERIVCPPTERPEVDTQALATARAARLNANGIATLAKQLGDPFQSVTARRVRTLRDAGKVRPVPGPWAPDWPELFVVGEVLDAHLAYPMRRRALAS